MVETMGSAVSAVVIPQAQQAQQHVQQQFQLLAEQQHLAEKQEAEKQDRAVSEKVHKIEYRPDAPIMPAMVHAAILPVGGGAIRGPATGQSSGGLF